MGLILLALDPDTLWLVALYGLLENLVRPRRPPSASATVCLPLCLDTCQAIGEGSMLID